MTGMGMRKYRLSTSGFAKKKHLLFSAAVIDMDWHLVDDVGPKYSDGWTGYT